MVTKSVYWEKTYVTSEIISKVVIFFFLQRQSANVQKTLVITLRSSILILFRRENLLSVVGPFSFLVTNYCSIRLNCVTWSDFNSARCCYSLNHGILTHSNGYWLRTFSFSFHQEEFLALFWSKSPNWKKIPRNKKKGLIRCNQLNFREKMSQETIFLK